MKTFVAVAALLHVASCGFVSVRMPYQNPAGVTYVNGFQGQGYQATAYGAAAGAAVAYAQPQPLQYQSHAGLQYQSAGLQYQSPLQYQAGLRYATPAAAVYPAKIEAHHVGYAAAQVPAVAAVPVVKHVPTVSNIPVTRYEAHHGVIEKQVDVAKPAVSTRKFEVRRPAIQKQFYDIEERVIIRPAGSALVELDEPTSKLQRGPAVLSESSPLSASPSPFSHQLVAHSTAFSHSPSAPSAIPVVAHAPVHVTVAPVISHAPVSHLYNPGSSSSSASSSSVGESERSDDESLVVESADFRNAQYHGNQQESSQSSSSANQLNEAAFHGTLFRSAAQLNENQVASRGQERQQQEYFNSQKEYYNSQQEQHSQAEVRAQPSPNVMTRSHGAPLETIARFASQNASPSVLPSTRSSPEESRSNQQRLIDLLTARGGVAEVGFGRDGSSSAVGDAGNVRARVLSATPAPEYSEPTGERVSTRRVVISKPVETLQEIDVVEPATKFERISVQHPTVFKTAHLDHVQVHGSVPVIGKALAPAVAHAAVPVYQKTVTPATYQYYKR